MGEGRTPLNCPKPPVGQADETDPFRHSSQICQQRETNSETHRFPARRYHLGSGAVAARAIAANRAQRSTPAGSASLPAGVPVTRSLNAGRVGYGLPEQP